MQEVQATPAALADVPSRRQEPTYRAAFVCVGNLASVREVFGFCCAQELNQEIVRRLGEFTQDPALQIEQVGDDCVVVWLARCAERNDGVLEQLLVQAGSRPVQIHERTFVPALHAGWTALQTEQPRALSADESSYVLYASASAAPSPAYGSMWRGDFDRFRADMEIAADIARAISDDRVGNDWQGVVSPYSPVNVLYWRGVPCPTSSNSNSNTDAHPASQEVFMPALERLGLTRLLDRAMALQVLERLLGDPSLRLACCISAMSVQNDHYWTRLLALLSDHPAAASRFTLEISGRTSLPSLDSAAAFCAAVRECGACIAMAGFGSGPINLEGLQACRPQTLLLDASFVLRGRHEPEALRDMIRICSHLAEQIVAAGVESARDYSHAMRAGARWMCGRFVNGASFDPSKAFALEPEDNWIFSDSPGSGRTASSPMHPRESVRIRTRAST